MRSFLILQLFKRIGDLCKTISDTAAPFDDTIKKAVESDLQYMEYLIDRIRKELNS